jgi:NADH-quinone oxidoreductase subunit J
MVSSLLASATLPDSLTFAIAAVVVVAGALGVVFMKNPVHSALMLVMTLFGIAVLFVEQDAQFLAAVQVIVYTGAIVVLFLFVIMLLGVDRQEKIMADTFTGQRLWALLVGAGVLAEVILLGSGHWTTGATSVTAPLEGQGANVNVLGDALFTTYLLPFEVTSALLIVAVVGAVVLARRRGERAGEDDQTPGVTDEFGVAAGDLPPAQPEAATSEPVHESEVAGR